MASFNIVLTISANVTKLQDVNTASVRCPATGEIRELTIHIPIGNDAQTPFALFVEDRQVFPVTGEWIKGNNSTDTLAVKIPVNVNEIIELRGLNTDPTDEHTVRMLGTII